MARIAAKNPPSVRRLQVGDRVRFRWSLYDVEDIVIEDRGGLSVSGGQIVRIAFDPDPADADPAWRIETERPAGDVQIIT